MDSGWSGEVGGNVGESSRILDRRFGELSFGQRLKRDTGSEDDIFRVQLPRVDEPDPACQRFDVGAPGAGRGWFQ